MAFEQELDIYLRSCFTIQYTQNGNGQWVAINGKLRCCRN